MKVTLHGVLTAVVAGIAIVALAISAVLAQKVTTLGHTATTQSQQIRQQAAAIAATAGRENGAHRDLITCEDLQELTWQISGSDSLNGSITGVAGPAPISLPAHCINR